MKDRNLVKWASWPPKLGAPKTVKSLIDWLVDSSTCVTHGALNGLAGSNDSKIFDSAAVVYAAEHPVCTAE